MCGQRPNGSHVSSFFRTPNIGTCWVAKGVTYRPFVTQCNMLRLGSENVLQVILIDDDSVPCPVLFFSVLKFVLSSLGNLGTKNNSTHIKKLFICFPKGHSFAFLHKTGLGLGLRLWVVSDEDCRCKQWSQTGPELFLLSVV